MCRISFSGILKYSYKCKIKSEKMREKKQNRITENLRFFRITPNSPNRKSSYETFCILEPVYFYSDHKM